MANRRTDGVHQTAFAVAQPLSPVVVQKMEKHPAQSSAKELDDKALLTQLAFQAEDTEVDIEPIKKRLP